MPLSFRTLGAVPRALIVVVIAFALAAQSATAQESPRIDTDPSEGWLNLFHLPGNTEVVVEIDGEVAAEVTTTEDGEYFFETLDNLAVGSVVSVLDATTEEVLVSFTIELLTIDPIADLAEGEVSGTAPPDREVAVRFVEADFSGFPPTFTTVLEVTATSDGDGAWVASFDPAGLPSAEDIFVVTAVLSGDGGDTYANREPGDVPVDPTPTPTQEPTPTPTEPAVTPTPTEPEATPTPTEVPPTATPTMEPPGPPATGQGTMPASGAPIAVLLGVVGLAAIALGAGSLALGRRRA
jgi:hypothetical protein